MPTIKTMEAYKLLAKLRLLTLVGQNKQGELEWIGNDGAWDRLETEEESILRDYELTKI